MKPETIELLSELQFCLQFRWGLEVPTLKPEFNSVWKDIVKLVKLELEEEIPEDAEEAEKYFTEKKRSIQAGNSYTLNA